MIISAFPMGEQSGLADKQDKLTGMPGQVVGFDADGNAVAQEAPDTGVVSFNGRHGTVSPQTGDYTAEQVGAAPVDHSHPEIDEELANKADNTHTHTAEQVGALPLSGGTMSGSVNFNKSACEKLSAIGLNQNGNTIWLGHFNSKVAIVASESDTTKVPIFLKGLSEPVTDNGAANKKYVDDKAAKYLPLAGGTMAGNLDMNNKFLLNPLIKLNSSKPVIRFRSPTISSPTISNGDTEADKDTTTDLVRLIGIKDPEFNHDASNKLYVDTQISTRAPTSHNHSATNITSGTLPTSRGGTGGTSSPSAIGNLVSNLSEETTVATNDLFPFRDTSAATGKKISFTNLRNAIVSAWAQAAAKPTYTASEVGALPSTGGTLTGNLRIKGSGNYGMKLNLGDSDYVYLYEPTDDCLEIKGNKQINLVTQKLLLNGEEFSGGGAKIATGTYVGNVAVPSYTTNSFQSARSINLGFRPKFVFVGCVSLSAAEAPWSMYYDERYTVYVYSNYAYDGYPFKSSQGDSTTNLAACLEITSTGFNVRNARYRTNTRFGYIAMNEDGYTYAYFAIG